MAKVTITIQDQMPNGVPNGRVKTHMNPSAETLLRKLDSHGPDSLTPAEGYAFTAINAIQAAARNQEQASNKIYVPKFSSKG